MAIGIYLTTSLVVFTTLVVLLRMGFEVEGVAGGAGTLGAAWIGLKLTQPFRMAGTALLTPPVAIALRRRRAGSSDPT